LFLLSIKTTENIVISQTITATNYSYTIPVLAAASKEYPHAAWHLLFLPL